MESKHSIRPAIRDRYLAIRADYPCGGIVGENAKQALSTARVDALWETLERAGLVKFETPYDEVSDLDSLVCDRSCYRSDAAYDASRQRTADRANTEGIYGIRGSYRVHPDTDWIADDSVWGFVGEDWKNSGYDADVRANTVDALLDALRSRCPRCRTPRR